MDGRAQLQSLARAIGSSSDIEAAWAGTGKPVDVRKDCGIWGEDQPIRIPFLRHVCRGCQAIWVPGICGDCAATSVTFTLDGQLSRFASCGCGGGLRQVAYVPKPRVSVDPEVAAARKVVVEQRKKQAHWTSRVMLVLIAAVATFGAGQMLRHNHDSTKVVKDPVSHVAVKDDPTLTMRERGQRAAARLQENGESHDVFACAAELPAPAPTAVASEAPNVPAAPTVSREGATEGSKDFLTGCLTG